MRILIAVLLFIPTAAIEAQNVKWEEWKPLSKRMKEKTLFADLINHTFDPVLNHDLMTNAHETTHMIQSDMRQNIYKKNKKAKKEFKVVNGFYVGKNKCVTFIEPKTTLARISTFVPQKLKGSRFNLYLIRQQTGFGPGTSGWNKRPLYILDEWTAYCNGAQVGLNQVEKLKVRSDLGEAPIEFMVYSIATMMAIEKDDPKWLSNNPNFVAFVRWQCIRSFRIYDESQKHKKLKWDNKFYNIFKSKEGLNFRNYMKVKLKLDTKNLVK